MAVTHMADPIVKLKCEGFIFLVDKGILKYHKFICTCTCTCNWQYTCLIFMSKAVGIINFSSMFTLNVYFYLSQNDILLVNVKLNLNLTVEYDSSNEKNGQLIQKARPMLI